MSKMSEIDYTIKEYLKRTVRYIVVIFITIVISILIYIQTDIDTKKAQEKENRVDIIEVQVQNQMNYIHELEAKVDNLERQGGRI